MAKCTGMYRYVHLLPFPRHYHLLSTHANRPGVDRSFTVCFCLFY